MTEVLEDSEVEATSGGSVSLYNKYRPHRFSDVLGQGNKMEALRKAVENNEVKQGYLFSGPRGCGKTTSARLLAAAVNCTFSNEGEPCGDCDDCTAIMSGQYLSGAVNELNATDQRGIDDIRRFLENVAVGSSSKRKVYIIDEVHQLSRDAASLLLKTLEEPPSEDIIFILATTDPQKLPETIPSRLTHFKFNLIHPDILHTLCNEVCEKEGIELSEKDLWNVVASGRKSARDTLSALQLASMGITPGDAEVVKNIMDGLLEADLGKILVSIAQAEQDGGLNPMQVGEDVMEFWRDAIMYQQNPDLVMAGADRLDAIRGASKQFSRKELVRHIETAGSTLATMRTSGNNRIGLEAGLARMLTPIPSTARLDAILDRIDDLEETIKKMSVSVPVQIASPVTSTPVESDSAEDQDDPWAASRPESSTPENVDWDLPKKGEATEQEPQESKQEEVSEESTPRRRPRRGTKRRSRREEPEQVDETPPAPEAEEVSDPEPPKIADTSNGDHQKAWDEAIDNVSGRSKTLLLEGSFKVDDSGRYIIYTERRLSARSQERLSEALGECAFELID